MPCVTAFDKGATTRPSRSPRTEQTVSQASAELRGGDPAERARAWHHASQAAVSDVIEPWAHGTVVRATRYPNYWDFNVVRVEEEPTFSVDDLAAFADDVLAGLELPGIDSSALTRPSRFGRASRRSAGGRGAWCGCDTKSS